MHIEPLSPQEIIARGLVGTWTDMENVNGAEWVNIQKEKRKARNPW